MLPELIPGAVREHAQPLGAAHRVGSLGDRDDLDAVIGPVLSPAREHLPRAGPVELFGAVEQRDRESALADQPNRNRRTDDDRRAELSARGNRGLDLNAGP